MGAHPRPITPRRGAKHAGNGLISIVATKLDDARVLQGMSIETLANKSGVPPVAIVRLLRGEVNSRMSTIADLAQALGLDMRSLLGGREADVSSNDSEFSTLLREIDPDTRRAAIVLLHGIQKANQKETKR